jgi:quinol monooxygenase YgiN
MLTRIVKLTFEESKIQEFLDFFETIKHKVNTFEGCKGMQLLRDIDNPNIVFTYSHWKNVESLNIYRDSDVFGDVWPTIKPWFSEKPEAWSVSTHFNGFEHQAVE